MSCRDELVTRNLGLVHSCCHKFTGKGIEYDDLYQVGCIGLIKAAERFDESLGFQFSTYAVPVILGEIKRLFRDYGPIKVSRSVKELGVKINAARQELENSLDHEPTVSEIAHKLNVNPEDVAEAVCVCRPPESLTAYSDDGVREMDLAVEDQSEQISGRIAIEQAIERLNERDRRIVKARFYEQKTQSQIAEELQMSQVQVSRREKQILKEIRIMLI